MMIPAPTLKPICTLKVELGPMIEMGPGRAGNRRIFPIIGGTVEGPELSGTITNLGADWQTLFADGTANLDTRYAFETHDGAVIEIINQGFRHGPPEVLERLARGEEVPAEDYYMRTSARFETGDPRYQWVNKTIFIGTGMRKASAVEVAMFAVE